MNIEIWSDIACPFCYIGKRRLEKAIDRLNLNQSITIEWKSFLLNPNLTTNPDINMVQSLSDSKGWSIPQTQQLMKQVVDMAATEDLAFNFDIAKVANTSKAHRLLQLAKFNDKGNELKEALLEAYFIKGINVDDDQELLKIAEKSGLKKEDIMQCLKTDLFKDQVLKNINEAQEIGVRGVPFFVIDRKFGISGAQPVEVFVDTLNKAISESIEIIENKNSNDNTVCDVDGNC
jgi:predicted DsbA family dithiol-disulfide isomerase